MVLSFGVKNNQHTDFIFYGVKNKKKTRLGKINTRDDMMKDIIMDPYDEIKVIAAPSMILNPFKLIVLFFLLGIWFFIALFTSDLSDLGGRFYYEITIPVKKEDMNMRYDCNTDLIEAENITFTMKGKGMWIIFISYVIGLSLVGLIIWLSIHFNYNIP